MAIVFLVAGHHSPGGVVAQLEITPGQGGGRLAAPTDQRRKIKYLYAWPAGQGDAAQNGQKTTAGFKCCLSSSFLRASKENTDSTAPINKGEENMCLLIQMGQS